MRASQTKKFKLAILIFILSFFLFSCGYKSSDHIFVIEPYKSEGRWYFDDAKMRLSREPFVKNIGLMIEIMTVDIPDAENGFKLFFSAKEFPDYSLKLKWTRSKNIGNYYYCKKMNLEGWLCPALLKYYKTPPPYIYLKAEKK